jgi:hypothetical protein
MRDLSDDELKTIYVDRRCPFCATAVDQFDLGPRGGMSRNVSCPGCRARLNILAPDLWQRWPTARLGQVIEEPVIEAAPVTGGDCPGCGRVMTVREKNEQGVCNECASGERR